MTDLDKWTKRQRMILMVVVALLIATSAVNAQGSCSGAKFMQILTGFTSVAMCTMFGPGFCVTYAIIVLSYQFVVWLSSGC